MSSRVIYFCVIVLMLVMGVESMAQSVQYGYTEEYNGAKEKTPLSNVNVNAGGATAKSDANGRFKLEFKNLKVGDRVNADVNSVALLKGYVVFNKEAIEQWTVSGKSVYFRIVLCKKKVFDNLVMTYYNVSDKSYKEQLRKEREKIEKMKRDEEIRQSEYERLLKEADDRYLNALKHLRENAELVARIDESELDEEQARILELAKEGRLDEAVEMIKKSNTVELFDKAVKKNEYATQQKRFYEQKEAESQEEWSKLLARMNEEEHFIRKAIETDSAGEEAKAYLSLSLLLQGRYEEAETIALEIKNLQVNGKPLKESMLQFLAKMEDEGLIPAKRKDDVEKFKNILNK